MKAGYFCEECEISIWPTTTRSELQWLKDRVHVVREVSRHTTGGLDMWIVEGYAFLDEHSDHNVIVVTKK